MIVNGAMSMSLLMQTDLKVVLSCQVALEIGEKMIPTTYEKLIFTQVKTSLGIALGIHISPCAYQLAFHFQQLQPTPTQA